MKNTNQALLKLPQTHFGPKDLKGNRKEARPLSPICFIHLILKAKVNVFDPHETDSIKLIREYAERNLIELHSQSLNYNHVHLLIRIPNKCAYDSFVRSVTAALARKHKAKGLFPERPFTRLIRWGQDFQNVKRYIELNQLEALGVSKKLGREII